ncbi:MAG: flavodoxin family protein [candidate division WOR-3 bacterium]|nr:flavodoxin family protein [candidate division WOR-3 bacterium]
MKIAILIASERKNGNCELLGRYVDRWIREKGGVSNLVYLRDSEIKQCQGCMSCVFKNAKCKIEDDLYKLAGEMINADGLILFAPTYVLTIPGKLKIFLDRFLCLYPLIKDKPERPALSIGVASPIDWNQFQLPLMNILLLALGFRVMDSYFIFGAGQGEVLLNDNIKRLEKSIEEMFVYKPAPYKSVNSKYCPIDFCDTFQYLKDDLFRCPVCLTPARFKKNGFFFDEKDLNKNRWTKEKIEEHFKEWILTTKERFRRLLPEIHRRKKEMGLI